MPAELIPKTEHEHQIKAYRKEYSVYEQYAKALKEVLERACKYSAPEALVQSRAKTISSFAEKCARKYEKYKNAINQFTDLCGARVIVQTLEQVQAVRNFIEANFKIIEKEDKGLLLQQEEFGYRDMHYIVQLKRNRNIGFSAEYFDRIGERKAEIQVRTWVQHAWADTLHDRMYKAKLKLSPEINRTGALLAAIMEDGDRTFSRLALKIDGMIANYSEYASKSDVNHEIEIRKLLLENEPEDSKRPLLALQASRLLAASGEFGQVVELLDKYEKKVDGALGCEICLHLGFSLCKEHRRTPGSPEFDRGLKLLLGVIDKCECSDICEVPNLRKQQNIEARAHAYLGWSFAQLGDNIKNAALNARNHYQAALEREPKNPYYLSDVLGYEIYCTRNRTLAGSMRATILEAIKTCREHALSNTEMPYACFTAGRLNLLLGSCTDPRKPEQALQFGYAALGWYARGINHYLSDAHVVPPEVLEYEIEWLNKVKGVDLLPEQYSWSFDLLEIANGVKGQSAGTHSKFQLKRGRKINIAKPVLVIAGGAASIAGEAFKMVFSLLFPALSKFTGTVISGGTKVGVPGCVGEIAKELKNAGKIGFVLIGYTDKSTDDAAKHEAYDKICSCDSDFNPDLVLQSWKDVLAADIDPKEVMVLGFGGGSLSAAEYQIGAALGASVSVLIGTGGSADDLSGDPLWARLPNFYPLPADRSTIRALVIPAKTVFDEKVLEDMAKDFHKGFLAASAERLPSNMRPWKVLDETFKKANREQARYSIEILEAAGFGVEKVETKPAVFKFEDKDLDKIEQMAEMEHGRWNIERLRDGWRFGKLRDDRQQIHDCIVAWGELPEAIKPYDRNSVRAFPEILAKAGFEVYRLDSSAKDD